MDTKPWLKSYPSGIPYEINPDVFTSVVDVFLKSVEKFRNRIAYISMGATLTFGDVDELSIQFASYLQNVAGLKPGDRIAIQLPNLLQFPIAMLGALRAGLIVVNTNPLYSPREMEHQFKDSEAKAVLVLENFAKNLETVLPNTKIKTVIITKVGDLLQWPKGHIVNFAIKYIKKVVPPFNLPGAVNFLDVLKEGTLQPFREVPLKNSDVAFLQYTGGTTGVAKGAVLSHRNIVANMEQISAWITHNLKEGEETVVTAIPIYHVFSLTVNIFAFLKLGGTNLLIANPRDIRSFVKELQKYPVSVFPCVNTLFNALLNNEDFCKLDFSHLKVVVGGGMAVQRAVAERWKKVTGVPLIEAYGLTETSPALTGNPLDGHEQIGSIGLPFPSTEVKLIDENENEVKVGERGEICARGPQVMSGYWKRPDETAKVMTADGYFKTGDIGIAQADGFLKIVDRKKDMILVSGFNVYPNEIEDFVSMHPGVLEVAAIGVPDEKSGEVVKIFVVKKDPNLTADALRDFCRTGLTAYKVPRHVEFRTELPKSNVGKILRRELKENK